MKTIYQMLRDSGQRVTKTEGCKIGLEIEVEGHNLPHNVDGWNAVPDGSLRGESIEYVFNTPMSINAAKLALKRLDIAFKKEDAQVLDTGYAGIHVHVNVQDFNFTQVFNYCMAYYLIDNLAVRWAGPDRVGNLFCLSITDATFPLRCLRTAVEEQSVVPLGTDDIRYASLNLKALSQYGSLEFRSLRSTIDRAVIGQWVDMLLELRIWAENVENSPRELIEKFSTEGAKHIVKQLLPNNYKMFDGIEDYDNLVRKSVRAIQDVVYTVGKRADEVPEPVRGEGGPFADFLRNREMQEGGVWGVGRPIPQAPRPIRGLGAGEVFIDEWRAPDEEDVDEDEDEPDWGDEPDNDF